MCNVVQFQFTCQHHLRLRRSRCKGTKHKATRTSIKAACTSESFLTISLKIDCGPCEHHHWEAGWITKLERAKTFLEKLTLRRMPGTAEIAILVKELEAQYTSASWDTRSLFAQAPKSRITRVKISDYKKARSPLLYELRPEDIVEAERVKEWAEMDENDYDDNYVASTDPIHPVSTDYSHPMDDDDGSWILNHLSPGEMEGTSEETVVDFDGSGWTWDNNDDDDQGEARACAERLQEFPNRNDNEWPGTDYPSTAQALVAWGPEAEESEPSMAKAGMAGLLTEEEAMKERVAEAIKAFWTVVNEDVESRQHSQRPVTPNNDPVNRLLDNLDISDSLTAPSTHLSTPSTPKRPRPSADKLRDSLPSSHSPASTPESPPPPPQPTTPLSPNSTRAWYDKQRKFLQKRRLADLNVRQYYSDWLLVSRYEVRAFEGPEGRGIPDPPVLRQGEGEGARKTGWWR